jgi:hypothetical protein
VEFVSRQSKEELDNAAVDLNVASLENERDGPSLGVDGCSKFVAML